MNLYITADRIGAVSGGGVVTRNEYEALASRSADEVHPLDASRLDTGGTPFDVDQRFHDAVKEGAEGARGGHAHLYAGCFSKTVQHLKAHLGMKVSYTAAAHDIKLSREEHEAMGLPFDYPHLTDPALWSKYLDGYLLADLVICPSELSAGIMRGYGCKNVVVVPHGVEIPRETPPLPKRFAIGYFGALGPDKGVRYLLDAWKRLGYRDATLVLGGRASVQAPELVRRFGGGNVEILGEVKDLADFHRRISLYVQPSVTEGFGIEVLEAMAHGRPVVASRGAGASECLVAGDLVAIRSAEQIAASIDRLRGLDLAGVGTHNYSAVQPYAWDRIKIRYVEAWRKA